MVMEFYREPCDDSEYHVQGIDIEGEKSLWKRLEKRYRARRAVWKRP